MDDLLISGNSFTSITKFRECLGSHFHIKDLGPLKYFPEIEVAHNSLEIYYYQWKYTLHIIFETSSMRAKPIYTNLE